MIRLFCFSTESICDFDINISLYNRKLSCMNAVVTVH